MIKLNTNSADQVWSILMDTCGATEYWRTNFIHHATEGLIGNGEYRFQGKLGFGGKIWLEITGFRVTCYPEDENHERLAMINAANSLLKEVYRLILLDGCRGGL